MGQGQAGLTRAGQGCTGGRLGDSGAGGLPLAGGLAAVPPQAPHAGLPHLGPVPEIPRVQHPQPDGGHELLLRGQMLGAGERRHPGVPAAAPMGGVLPPPLLTSISRKVLMGKLGLAAGSAMGGVRSVRPPHCTSRLGARTLPRSPRSPHASTWGAPSRCHPPPRRSPGATSCPAGRWRCQGWLLVPVPVSILASSCLRPSVPVPLFVPALVPGPAPSLSPSHPQDCHRWLCPQPVPLPVSISDLVPITPSSLSHPCP